MSISNFRVVASGGKLQQQSLSSVLDEKTYDCHKIHVWLTMLQDKTVPTKWFKATKKGTKVSFNDARTQKEWDDSYAELKGFIATVNEKHDLDIELIHK